MKWTPPEGFWKSRDLPEPLVEHLFHPTRKWRFDFAWEDGLMKVAVEVEGGTWMAGGGHGRGSGYARDMEKYNEATRMGWEVYRFTPQQMQTDNLQCHMTKKIKLRMKNMNLKTETTTEFLRSVLL